MAFAAEVALFGAVPAPYHAVNLALHAAVVLLAWRLLRTLVDARAAWIAAALFACHPLQSEVVLAIKAQDDLLAAACILLALLCARTANAQASGSWRAAVALLPFGVGLLSKENALATPVLLFALDHFAPTQRRTPRYILALMLVLAGAYLVLRHSALAVAASPQVHERTWLFPSSLAALPYYWKQFLWPWPLSIDHPWATAAHLGSGLLAASLALQGAVVFLAWRSSRSSDRAALAWFYASLLVSLNPLGGVVVYAERFAFLPLLGLALCVAVRAPRTRAAAIAAALVLTAGAALSNLRARDWLDNEALFRATLRTHPHSQMARLSLRRELVTLDRAEEATALLGEAPERAPTSFVERGALADIALIALIALKRGDNANAARLYGLITSSKFAQWDDELNWGVALTNLGEHATAREAFESVLRERPNSAPALRMLGRLDLEAERWSEALERLRMALAQEPGHQLTNYFVLVTTWKAEGDERALEVLEDLRRRGISIGVLLEQDAVRWAACGARLRSELNNEMSKK
jgi:tetratricopeptide (TPR) repeat protein